MNLTDLDPRWKAVGDNPRAALVFKCPCCRNVWLTCKFVPMKMSDQMKLFEDEGRASGGQVVPTRQEFAWSMTGSGFHDLSVTPSVDASASGHWHGFITNGKAN